MTPTEEPPGSADVVLPLPLSEQVLAAPPMPEPEPVPDLAPTP